MKQLFTHENRLIVFNLKNLLQEQGIECRVENEFASGGVGLLSPLETWPELWLLDQGEFERAERIIQQALAGPESSRRWRCTGCGERNDDNFEICWSCNRSKTA